MKNKPTSALGATLDTIRLVFESRRRKRWLAGGFEIRDISTWDMEYREGDHILKISTGIGNGSSGKWYDTWVTVELDKPLLWEPPHSVETIGSEKKTQIKANIEKYFDRFRIPFEFVE